MAAVKDTSRPGSAVGTDDESEAHDFGTVVPHEIVEGYFSKPRSFDAFVSKKPKALTVIDADEKSWLASGNWSSSPDKNGVQRGVVISDNDVVLAQKTDRIVFTARLHDLKTRVAVKRITLRGPAAEGPSAPYHADMLKAYREFRHEHLVNVYDIIVRKSEGVDASGAPDGVAHSRMYVIMDLHMAGSLHDLMSFCGKKAALPESIARSLFAGVVKGVGFLHDQDLTHRMLKCDNILLGDDGTAKVSDYYNARKLDPVTTPKSTKHAAFPDEAYLAPEVLQNKNIVDGWKPVEAHLDIYSMGVILYRMIGGRMPFTSKNIKGMKEDNAIVTYDIPPHVSAEGQRLLMKMLHSQTEFRCSLPTVLEHDWIRKDDRIWFSQTLVPRQAFRPLPLDTIFNDTAIDVNLLFANEANFSRWGLDSAVVKKAQGFVKSVNGGDVEQDHIVGNIGQRKLIAKDICSVFNSGTLKDGTKKAADETINESVMECVLTILCAAAAKASPSKAAATMDSKSCSEIFSGGSSIAELDVGKEVLCLPWYKASHWMLVVLYPSKARAELIDPFSQEDLYVEDLKKNLNRYFTMVTRRFGPEYSSWTVAKRLHLRHMNGSQSGLFVCMFAWRILNDSSLTSGAIKRTPYLSTYACAVAALLCEIAEQGKADDGKVSVEKGLAALCSKSKDNVPSEVSLISAREKIASLEYQGMIRWPAFQPDTASDIIADHLESRRGWQKPSAGTYLGIAIPTRLIDQLWGPYTRVDGQVLDIMFMIFENAVKDESIRTIPAEDGTRIALGKKLNGEEQLAVLFKHSSAVLVPFYCRMFPGSQCLLAIVEPDRDRATILDPIGFVESGDRLFKRDQYIASRKDVYASNFRKFLKKHHITEGIEYMDAPVCSSEMDSGLSIMLMAQRYLDEADITDVFNVCNNEKELVRVRQKLAALLLYNIEERPPATIDRVLQNHKVMASLRKAITERELQRQHHGLFKKSSVFSDS